MKNNNNNYHMIERFLLGFFGGISIMATSIPVYNYYVLPGKIIVTMYRNTTKIIIQNYLNMQ